MKTSELTGADLDCWAARTEGIEAEIYQGYCFARIPGESGKPSYRPSTNWTQGGPIIERELLTVSFDFQWKNWRSAWSLEADGFGQQYGPTPLIAAMRAYVASKFGEEVPDETA